MKGNYFLNPGNYVLHPGNYFLNPRFSFFNPRNFTLDPRNYVLNPGNYFLNPRNYFLKPYKLVLYLGPKPRNHLQNKDCFYQTQPLDKDSSQSLKVQRLPQTSEPCSHRERERGCHAGTLHSVSFYVFWLLSQNQSLFLSFQSVRSFNMS